MSTVTAGEEGRLTSRAWSPHTNQDGAALDRNDDGERNSQALEQPVEKPTTELETASTRATGNQTAARDGLTGEDGMRKEERGGDESSSESSESSSESSSSSTSEETGTSSVSRDSRLFMDDQFGEYLSVNCANNEAKFYLNRFSRGSRGRCVLFNDKWLTPNEFQAISGRQSSKDWKRSIRLKGRCLKEYINQGLFSEHLKTCKCRICAGIGAIWDRQEGELALAAKRRRLSQTTPSLFTPVLVTAPMMAGGGVGGGVGEPMEEDPTASYKLPPAKHIRGGGGGGGVATPRVRKRGGGRGGGGTKTQRVWSPSGGEWHV